MKKLTCTLMLITLMFCSMTTFFGSVQGATSVGGTISSDTTWTKANSPYQLTGNTLVQAGATLTIEPGVTVDFGTYFLQVNGVLRAQGTESNKILFTSQQKWITNTQMIYVASSNNKSASDQTIIENAIFNTTVLKIEACSPKINNNFFSNLKAEAITIISGAPTIDGNTITCLEAGGIYAAGSATLTNNIISCGVYNAIQASDTVYVAGNKITGTWIVASIEGHVNFERNTVTGGSQGLCSSTDGNIKYNYITGCSYYGITGSGTIQSNTITGNKVGIQGPNTNVPITQNNIFGNTANSIVLTISQNIDATNNWWGTTDSQTINQTIHDYKNDFAVGTVTYMPFLTQESSSAPTAESLDFTPAPTVSPQTTQSITQAPEYSSTVTTPPLSNSGQRDAAGLFDLENINIFVVVAIVVVVLAVITLGVYLDKGLKTQSCKVGEAT
jgi:hypothetical protein